MAPIIEVKNLSKCYRIGHKEQGYRTFRESIVDGIKAPFRNLKRIRQMTHFGDLGSSESNGNGESVLWALQGITIDIQAGEVLGIIGRNGAGKSTLLKVLSRITEPTSGEIKIRGRIASLLEVGTGFHPELTGRENIYLNGTILGMRRTEIDRKFDEIVDFAEVERFLDTPVKHYSSGMYVRLAFAVAAHLEPEILVIDEVLAVGDAAFQNKCLGKMSDVARIGRTVLFVSHNMAAIRNFCRHSVLLEQGTIRAYDTTPAVLSHYLTTISRLAAVWTREEPIPDSSGVYFMEIAILDHLGEVSAHIPSNCPFSIHLSLRATQTFHNAQIAIRVTNEEGIPIFTTANTDILKAYQTISSGECKFNITIPNDLLHPGKYNLIIAVMIPGLVCFDSIHNELSFIIEDFGSHATALNDHRLGVVTPLLEWKES
ncbi:MAG: ABC transporter ATP-binding protein [Syntrophobacteraceae bacterium]